MKKKVVTYVIGTLVAFLLCFFVFSINNGFTANNNELYRILSDSFFIVGTIYCCLGILFWVSNQGLFDMLGYGITKIFDLFKKNVKDSKYADYIEYKEARKDARIPWVFLVAIGGIFILIASLFLAIYLNV